MVIVAVTTCIANITVDINDPKVPPIKSASAERFKIA